MHGTLERSQNHINSKLNGGLAFLAVNLGLAHGTASWHFEGTLATVPFFNEDLHHVGNYVTSTFDDDSVANADVLALDLVHVVQRRVPHGDSR